MKRRSITKPPELTLFTDEDTGFLPHHILPRILLEAGLSVECLGSHLPRQVPDHEWLEFCGRKGWVGVTHDKRMRLSERSMVALLTGGAQVVTLIGEWKHEELAINLVNSVYVVEQVLRRERPPFILKLYMADKNARARGKAGKVQVYKTEAELIEKVGHLL